MEENNNKPVILLGITGSIAAFKGIALASMMVKQSIQVIPIMTENAVKMIGTMSLEAICSVKPITDLFNYPDPLAHVRVGDYGNGLLIAPATANIIAKIANGIADDALSTFALRFPPEFTMIAPAMETDMYNAIATQENVQKLINRGTIFVNGVPGRLASGKVGYGRMAEPEVIFDALSLLLEPERDLIGKKILISAGPTRESIDPVRYISNHSSGRMGIELARAARNRGALVELVLGPAFVDPPWGIKVDRVITADQMLESLELRIPQYDILIMAAAVSDFKMDKQNQTKLAKDELNLKFAHTPDILEVTKELRQGKFTVGFALETSDGVKKAMTKVDKKCLDMVILNDPSTMNAHDIMFTIIDKEGKTKDYSRMDKSLAANKILDTIRDKLNNS